MARELTTRQREVMEYIEQYIDRYERSPSQQEISKHFGWTSPYTVTSILNRLERRRLITRRPGFHRNIRLVNAS